MTSLQYLPARPAASGASVHYSRLQPVRAPASDEFCSVPRVPSGGGSAGTGTHVGAPGVPSEGMSTECRGTAYREAEIRAPNTCSIGLYQ
jgi:hypothetical protein